MKFAQQIAALLVSQKIIEQDETEIYVYGLELIISDVINFSAIIIVSVILQEFICTAIYLL